MALIVIFAAIAILSGIPTLIRYLNRKKDGIETNAVVSRIDWFPEDEDDHYYYLLRKVYGRKREGKRALGVPFHNQ